MLKSFRDIAIQTHQNSEGIEGIVCSGKTLSNSFSLIKKTFDIPQNTRVDPHPA